MEYREKLIKMMLRFGPIFLTILALTSVFVALLYNSVRIDQYQYNRPPIQYEMQIIDDQAKDLVWFIQISDIHLSKLGHEGRKTDLLKFATDYVDTIKPSVVLVTGDITDGRSRLFETGQQLEEWQAYRDVIDKSNVLNKTVWLDVRGNHDNLNVYRPHEKSSSLYRQYSVMGREHPRNYMHVLEKNGKNYSFIIVDGVQTPGIKIPFNFIGVLYDEDMKELRELSRQSQLVYHSQYFIWFGHYPTSSIASPDTGIRSIINGPYLCGHYHTTSGLVKKMHSTQQAGYVELELGDWKIGRRLRLAAIDHQLFSSIDFNLNDWPLVLLTNPKQAEQQMPKYEPINRIHNSTHIRAIAFSTAQIVDVSIRIDSSKEWKKMQHVTAGSPLYVLEWSPNNYAEGLHVAHLRATDTNGRTREFDYTFSLDGSIPEFPLLARILIRLPFKVYAMSMFLFLVFLTILPIVMFNLIVRYSGNEVNVKRHYRGTLLYKLYILANIRRISIPLVIIPVWCAIGPIFVGRFVDEAIGVCFTWGILIDNSFLHTGITYTLGSLFMIFIHIPTYLLLASQVNARYKDLLARKASQRFIEASSILSLRFTIWIVITFLQFMLGLMFLSAYGYLAFFSSFLFAWSIFIYSYCWFHALHLQSNDFEFSRSDYRESPSSISSN